MPAGVEDDPARGRAAGLPARPVITASGPAPAQDAAERPRRPITVEQAYLRKLPAPPPPHLRARPRIEPEQGILGLSRLTRSRLGSRLFNLFFVCVFALILVQMVVVLLSP